MTDLLKRLRKYRKGCGIRCCAYDSNEPLEECIEAADRIEQLEADNKQLLANVKNDDMWFRTYQKWCEMNGCAPSSSDLSAARAALEVKDG